MRNKILTQKKIDLNEKHAKPLDTKQLKYYP